MSIGLHSINKAFGTLHVLDSVSLEIDRGAVTALLGPSGCGKTTLLNIISGTDKEYQGSITGISDVRISYLFQEPRVLPWKTVRQNLEFILPEEIERDERNTLIDHHLGLVGLHDFDHYYPSQLSGGMRQRVAIARAFIFPADIILMDEPFQALDLRIKLSLLTVFKRLWMETEEVQHDKTALFVTHDVQEAILLGDRIVVLSERPARVRKKLVNTVARSERSLENEKILKMERDLYTLVT